jgi:hypothetical protein
MTSHRATDSSSRVFNPLVNVQSTMAPSIKSANARSRKYHADRMMIGRSINENNKTYFHLESKFQVRAMAERFGYSTSDKSFLVSIGGADSCSDI